ncbi:transcription factor DIVARICATA-like protein [Cinnamomum micranthum f. kanehirae]|uniref:Transcription factor DIVARICATA-like protein n=1 Tax=Cinnamomum micranthum f. kanehirae TaxID=337451 RepID=A0A3S3NBZ1_9MAGN|nr:transcription factor DIVARICATA-like protein [Cinnamomum micranthum f. kanehirae]
MAGEKASPLPMSPSLANESDSSAQTEWTELENKLFDNVLAMFSEGTPDRWEKLAKMVPGKTPEGVEKHFKLLVKDVEHIEPHQISVPDGLDKSEEKKMVEVVNSGDVKEKGKSKEKRVVLRKDGNPSNKGKGRLWTEEEHRFVGTYFFSNGLRWDGHGFATYIFCVFSFSDIFTSCFFKSSPLTASNYRIIIITTITITIIAVVVFFSSLHYSIITNYGVCLKFKEPLQEDLNPELMLSLHRLFLNGLLEYGKGDWKSISRDAVVSRTPAQVASHAQKHYLRMDNPGMRERQRPRLSENRDMDESTFSSNINKPIIPNPSPYPFMNFSPMAGTFFQTFNTPPPMEGGFSGIIPQLPPNGILPQLPPNGLFPEQPPYLYAGFGSFGENPPNNLVLTDGSFGEHSLNNLFVTDGMSHLTNFGSFGEHSLSNPFLTDGMSHTNFGSFGEHSLSNMFLTDGMSHTNFESFGEHSLSNLFPTDGMSHLTNFGGFGEQQPNNLSFPLNNSFTDEFGSFQGTFGGDPSGQFSYDCSDYLPPYEEIYHQVRRGGH